MIDRVQHILLSCSTKENLMPPTELYNEGWFLRFILDWFSCRDKEEFHALSFLRNSRWFSEALLSSQFLPMKRGDELGESYTHADGAIGHFTIGGSGRGDLNLFEDARQLSIIEAKMFSKLSHGVTHAKDFDQAARNVACIANVLSNVLSKANRSPSDMSHIGFYVLAPEKQLREEPTFTNYVNLDNIREKVEKRVLAYKGRPDFYSKYEWFNEWFIPTLRELKLECISWEDVISHILSKDAKSGSKIMEFYERCLEYNQFVANKT